MTHSITTADDLRWLLTHTQGFRGGQITDVHVAKRRMFDEESGREVTVGSTVTVLVRYTVQGALRVAKLSMQAVSDVSLFEQDGGDWALLGAIQVELKEGKLRFWFDPQGNLYVVCEEALFEEVSLPHPGGERDTAIEQWVFQADSGEAPTITWLLKELDQVGMPCIWKASARRKRLQREICWEGELVAAGSRGAVQNMSRDWVIDKLSVGITYDSDIEKARKLIKQIGQDLLKDPELAANIIEPLKMQGVEQFGDFAIQIRMKMMTKPGEQFVIRRKALALIKKSFDANGIKFAFPTVQVAGGTSDATAAMAQQALEMTKPQPAA